MDDGGQIPQNRKPAGKQIRKMELGSKIGTGTAKQIGTGRQAKPEPEPAGRQNRFRNRQANRNWPAGKTGLGTGKQTGTGRQAKPEPEPASKPELAGRQNRFRNRQANRNRPTSKTGTGTGKQIGTGTGKQNRNRNRQANRNRNRQANRNRNRQAKSEPEPTGKQNGTGYRTMLDTDGRKIGSCNKLK